MGGACVLGPGFELSVVSMWSHRHMAEPGSTNMLEGTCTHGLGTASLKGELAHLSESLVLNWTGPDSKCATCMCHWTDIH